MTENKILEATNGKQNYARIYLFNYWNEAKLMQYREIIYLFIYWNETKLNTL